jgi:hypothetical protein
MRQIFAAFVFAACGSPAVAQTPITGSISLIRTGWNADSFAIVTQEAIQNPANCPVPDGYISDKSLPGYSTFYAAALTVYAARQPIMITVANSECFAGRPKIIGINLPQWP